jgi:chemotaxis family two-component system sensor kinase Cph1
MAHPIKHSPSGSANDTSAASIQAPGTIQPHGVLLVFASDSHTCCQYSRNLEALAQRASDQILHAPAADLLGAELAELLIARLGRSPLGQRTVLGTKPLWQQRPFLVFAYRYERVYLVECCAVADPDQPESRADSQSVLRLAQHVQDIIRDLQATDSVAACCQRAAEWFRQVLGYDRVLVCCFDHDWHIQVIGEARRDDLEPWLGLWFPASDLPEQSRQVVTRNRVQILGDTLAPQVPLVPELNPVTGQPLNLSDCVLRSIASVQREYLAKLGVRGVLAISIVYQQRLWGLILCRQMTPRWIDPSICGLCEVIANQLAQQLAYFEQAQVRDAEGRLQQMMPVVTDLLLHDVEWSTALADPHTGLLELIDADGLAVVRHHELRTLGRTPSLPDLWTLLDWIEDYTTQPIYATNDLPAVCSTLAHLGETASGVLAIRCPGQERAYLLWLRGPARPNAPGRAGRLHPPRPTRPARARLQINRSPAGCRLSPDGRSPGRAASWQ